MRVEKVSTSDKQVSPIVGSEAPCCGGGLSATYTRHIYIFNNPQIQYFQYS